MIRVIHKLSLVQPITAEAGLVAGKFLDRVTKEQVDSVEGTIAAVIRQSHYFPAQRDFPAFVSESVHIFLEAEDEETIYEVRFPKHHFKAITELRAELVEKRLVNNLDTVRLRVSTGKQSTKMGTFFAPLVQIMGVTDGDKADQATTA